jgi:GNAT superfamily N-acetyltransferase
VFADDAETEEDTCRYVLDESVDGDVVVAALLGESEDPVFLAGNHWICAGVGDDRFGLEYYLGVLKSERGKGISGHLLNCERATMQQNYCDFVVGEVNVEKPETVAYWKRQGRRLLDAPYVQPPVNRESEPILGYRLMIVFFDPKVADHSWSVGRYLDVVKCFMRNYSDDENWQVSFEQTRALLHDWGHSVVKIVDLPEV